ncbi:MAG: hypothetical protein QM731_03055 [Chitinophagaceae bacterium]
MTFKPTILNITAGLFIAGCIVYTAFNYRQLSASEGWGVVGMAGLLGFGAILLVIDFIIQQFFTDRKTVNIIGTLIIIAAALLLLSK